MSLTPDQSAILDTPLAEKIFLIGPAGCGKTTVGVERLRLLLQQQFAADSILILTPQRTLQEPYRMVTHGPEARSGGLVTLATLGGIARRMVDLFWPLVTEVASFTHPNQPPIFLTLETAQYYMARIVRPLREQGFFAAVTIDPNRLYSQILDNLNKSAIVGFHHNEIGSRLDSAWYGDPAQRRIYTDAQVCATHFRTYCLEHNLLDFSLQVEIFQQILWQTPECHAYLTRQYRHIIYDNVEEDFPVAHDLVMEWLPIFESALIISDNDGGYRHFLGADPESALRLRGLCSHQVELNNSFVINPGITLAIQQLSEKIMLRNATTTIKPEIMEAGTTVHPLDVLIFPPPDIPTRFYPQMLDWVVGEIHRLINDEHLSPSEIAVLVPYLSDALRFSLYARLDDLGIPWRSHRPSRSLRDEPASACLLTLAALAHPSWKIQPTKFDVAYALLFAIEDMDLVRAQLLTEIVYHIHDLSLSSFEQIRSEMQERITYIFGTRYDQLRDWLLEYLATDPVPLDHFLRRLFGEILSQKGFGFHRDPDAARVAASLVDSFHNFRQSMASVTEQDQLEPKGIEHLALGSEYFTMLQDGVIAAQYMESWQMPDTDAILLAPAHTFLMMNRPVTMQFWLDVGANGWWERLFQPLTQPHVLSRQWAQLEKGTVWSDAHEVAANQQALVRLITGLLRRCRKQVYLGLSDLGESGFEQRGPLLKAIWKIQMQAKQARE